MIIKMYLVSEGGELERYLIMKLETVLLPVVYLSWESGLSSESHTLFLCLSTEFCC